MSLTKVTYSMITKAPVNVADFGAVGDGVASGTGTTNGDIIGVGQDDGSMHWTTIASGGGTTSLTLTAGLTANAASGQAVAVNRWTNT